jgi:enoyl-CoA hydratase/carnithine racemase
MSIQTNNVGDVLEICIARPEKRNAISTAMYQELTRLLDEANSDKECAAVIVHGAGGNFTVGADINDFQTRRGNEDSPAVTFLRKMAAIDVPLIVAVEGLAIGIGATMLQHVDFAYASQDARFRMPFVSLGLCPEGASSYLLESLVGVRKAREWLMLGKFFDAEEAFDAGLLTSLTQEGEALARARETAAELAKLPKTSVRATKRMLNHANRAAVGSALDLEVKMFAELLNTEATQEIFKSFLNKKR